MPPYELNNFCTVDRNRVYYHHHYYRVIELISNMIGGYDVAAMRSSVRLRVFGLRFPKLFGFIDN